MNSAENLLWPHVNGSGKQHKERTTIVSISLERGSWSCEHRNMKYDWSMTEKGFEVNVLEQTHPNNDEGLWWRHARMCELRLGHIHTLDHNTQQTFSSSLMPWYNGLCLMSQERACWTTLRRTRKCRCASWVSPRRTANTSKSFGNRGKVVAIPLTSWGNVITWFMNANCPPLRR